VSRRNEAVTAWRTLHNEKLHNLYTSKIIIRVIKSREVMWAGHVACMGKMRNLHKILVKKNLKEKSTGRT
jgi:hypothetical protein